MDELSELEYLTDIHTKHLISELQKLTSRYYCLPRIPGLQVAARVLAVCADSSIIFFYPAHAEWAIGFLARELHSVPQSCLNYQRHDRK